MQGTWWLPPQKAVASHAERSHGTPRAFGA
jgi:hypothetical protein